MQEAEWIESEKIWVIKTTKNEKFRGRFFINCAGFLHKPNIPEFRGKSLFEGRMFHSRQWEWDFDYSNKKVAVVGSG